MVKKTVLRLLLPFFFAFIGLVLGIFAAPILLAAGCPPGSAMGVGGLSMFGGSMLGSLFGCAAAVPRGDASTDRRILSFVLSPAVAYLGLCACAPFLLMIPHQYERASLLVMFLLIMPALSLLGFSIPVLLSVKRT
jgi:hypothetical protein